MSGWETRTCPECGALATGSWPLVEEWQREHVCLPLCPRHKIRDCSPLLNSCSLLTGSGDYLEDPS